MSANSKDLPTAVEEVSAAEEQAFRVLNAYWEGLRRGGPTDPQAGLEQPPEGAADPVELQVLAALDVARAALAEDSRPPTPEAWAAEAEELTGRPLLQPATRLGACQVRGLLGWGGMGEVYLAEHEVLQRPVAIKVLPVHLADNSAAAERFHHSVCILARLSHPNLAAAYDANVHEGRLYLVMEYVPGVDLRTRVRQTGPLGVAEACGVIRQAALGLEYLHRQGVVHRDIKPANLMLGPEGTVKILDLGLARWTEPGGMDGGSAPTLPGAVLGTLDYIAPEQARDARRADARSDLYSLGCTFYFLLTGQPPFASRSPLEKVVAHAAEPPRPVQELRPDVPQAVAAIVQRLLAKQPEERYASAQALIEALDAAPIEAPPQPLRIDDQLDSAIGSGAPSPAGVPRKEGRKVALLGGARKIAYVLGRRRLLVTGLGVAAVVLTAALAILLRPSPLVVHKLEVQHLAKVGEFDHPRGVLGVKSFAGRLGDGVTVHAELSEPAYCYLIAYRPDGADELCFPEDAHTAPPLTNQPRYPLVKFSDTYGLDEGKGLMVFALVVSRQPLPTYEEWRTQRGPSPWRKTAAPPEVVWRYDGRELLAATPDDPAGTRGKGREMGGVAPLAQLIDWLRQAPDVETVAAVAFPVLPAARE